MDYAVRNTNGISGGGQNGQLKTEPICRCRVLYLGSAVPHLSKEGLQGVQEPLRELYPECGVPGVGSVGPNGTTNGSTSGGSNGANGCGIDSLISVWSNGILVENCDDYGREVRRFFPIESLHYCAAVRYFNLPDEPNNNNNGGNGRTTSKFLPLDSPFLRHADSSHPPLFACILRRTTGIKVLECHAFVCKRDKAANALVRCCFHMYADNMYLKQMDENPYSQIEPSDSERNDSSKIDCLDGAVNISARNSMHVLQVAGNGSDGKPNELSSDTELPTSGSSVGRHSPEEDEEMEAAIRQQQAVNQQLLGNYKLWSGSKSLSGSLKNLNMVPSIAKAKLSKGLSMRSLRPRTMNVNSMFGPGPMQPGLPPFAQPMYAPMPPPPLAGQFIHSHYPPFMQQPFEKMDKASLKLWKKLKSKSMASLVPGPNAQPPLFFMPPSPPGQPIYGFTSQTPFFGHMQPMPPGPPLPITGNIHTIKKKSKKNKELQKLQAHQQQQWLLHQQQMFLVNQAATAAANNPVEMISPGQPMYMPPMRPLTPMSNYVSNNHSPIPNGYAMMPHSNSSISSMPNAAMHQNYLTGPRRKSRENYPNQQPLPPPPLSSQEKHHGSTCGLDGDGNSPFKRRQGHMNERAFSYSIRQEHRSRSGSLANLVDDQLDGSPHELNGANGMGPDEIRSRTSSSSLAVGHGDTIRDHRLSAALQQLQLEQVPKTASIKRSQLNGGTRNGQLMNAVANNGVVSGLRSYSAGTLLGQTMMMNGAVLKQVQPPAPPKLVNSDKANETKKKNSKK